MKFRSDVFDKFPFPAPPTFEEALKMNYEQPIVILDGVLKISYLGEKTISIIS
jgi:hypothetical protein